MNYDVGEFSNVDDNCQMKGVMVNGQLYEVYKYMKMKTLKRIIVFKEEMVGQ
jgi:hypothetical protein